MSTSESKIEPKTRRYSWLWPTITDAASAKEACRAGSGAAIFVAAVTAIVATASMISHTTVMGIDSGAFVDAAIFALLAWRIRRLSRVAAVFALVMYTGERIYMWASVGPSNPIVPIVITMALVSSVRGAFAFHRFQEQTTTQPYQPIEP